MQYIPRVGFCGLVGADLLLPSKLYCKHQSISKIENESTLKPSIHFSRADVQYCADVRTSVFHNQRKTSWVVEGVMLECSVERERGGKRGAVTFDINSSMSPFLALVLTAIL